MPLKRKIKYPQRQLRPNRLRAISELLPTVSKNFTQGRGFIHSEILDCWKEIVGEALALNSRPNRILFPKGKRQQGTLYIGASGPTALQIQHDEPTILQRINFYFGYPAIDKISISQVAFKNNRLKAEKSGFEQISRKHLTKIESTTKIISDPNLREALNKLGIALNHNNHRQKRQK